MEEKETEEKKTEDKLMRMIERDKFEEIESKIKPTAFKYCKSNSLLIGMKVRSYFCVFVFFFVRSMYKILSPVKALRGNKILVTILELTKAKVNVES